MIRSTQPLIYSNLPDISDPDLRGCWLNPRVPNGKDYSLGGNDMTPVGGCVLGDGSAVLNGTTGYLSKTVADFRSADTQGTILAWVKRSAINAFQTIFASNDTATGNYLFTCNLSNTANGDTVYLQLVENGATLVVLRGATVIPLGVYTRVAFLSTGSAYQLYINGQAESLTLVSGTNNGTWLSGISNRDNIVLGARAYSGVDRYLSGSLLDCRIYSRVLTPSELADDYKRGVPR